MRRHLHLVTLMGAAAIAAPANAQHFTYVGTLGRDTLSLEQVVRSPESITGEWISLYGGIMVHHYELTLRPDGTVSRYHLELHRLSGKVDGDIDIRFFDDSMIVRNADGKELRAQVGEALPMFTSTMGPIDLILTRARANGRDSSFTPTVGAFGPYRRGGMSIVFFGGDSVRFGNPRAPLVARIDAAGHVLGMSARATTTRMETRRVADFDVFTAAAHFPNVEDSVDITGVPAISPRDTVRATIGAASIMIDYGRPAVRGRNVFSHGILGDTIWRTGANAATQFVTTRDLIVGGDTLRAGAYSLWTRVSPDDSSYRLLFNSQTGQWGTEHHPERDVLSVPLSRSALRNAAERLTIRLANAGRTSQLWLEWANTALTVSMTSR
ncbi:MAG TPA: DUF2911 domain-containing protein [Gemmatimonadaceae bacterium]